MPVEWVITDASTDAGPLNTWVDSVNSFFNVSDKVNVNDVPDPETIYDIGDYSAFAFGASSFNSSVIVTPDSVGTSPGGTGAGRAPSPQRACP